MVYVRTRPEPFGTMGAMNQYPDKPAKPTTNSPSDADERVVGIGDNASEVPESLRAIMDANSTSLDGLLYQ